MRIAKKKVVSSALLLGTLGLLTNAFSYTVAPAHAIPFGNLFLFWAAGALGVRGACIAVAIGVIPESLVSGEHIYGVRLLMLCCGLAYGAQRFPRIPGYLLAAAMWLVVFTPALVCLRLMGVVELSLVPEEMLFSALAEVALAVVSGLLLMNPAIWTTIAPRPRHVDLQSLLSHFLALMGIGPLFLLVSIYGASAHVIPGVRDILPSLSSLFALALLAVALPAAAAWWIADLVKRRDARSLLPSTGTGKAFLQPSDWMKPESARMPDQANSSPHVRSGASFETFPQNAVCAVSRAGTVAYMNDTFRDMLGITRNDVIGQPLSALDLSEELRSQLEEIVERALERGRQRRELRANQLPEALRFFEVTAECSTPSGRSVDASNQPVLLTIRDISDRRTVESHLLQAQKVNSLSNVVSGLAHAFNNSLTAIVGQASFAQLSDDQEVIRRSLEEIVGSANLASDLVWKLIEYCEGRPEYMRKFDLSQTLVHTLDLVEKMAGEQCQLQYHAPELSIGVMGDANMLVQALSNLVINAKEAYPGRKGIIRVSLDTEVLESEAADFFVGARPGRYARIKVSDSGRGMSPDVLAKACEPLFTTKKMQGQSGLGLSIVFAIARAHDGFLTIESQPGKGTTVCLYLPEVELGKQGADRSDAPRRPRSLLRSGTEHERILVVEDEPAVRELVSRMLRELGYQVLSCASGEEALVIAEQDRFDLVLVDMMMPQMDGTELVQQLRASGKTANTLIMTGYGTGQRQEIEGTPVLPKPFDMQMLAEFVESALRKAQPRYHDQAQTSGDTPESTTH